MLSYRKMEKLNDGDLVIYVLEGSKTGIWQVRFKNPLSNRPHYVRKSTGFRNKADATGRALEIYKEYQARKHLNLATGSITMKEAIYRFKNDYDEVGRKTLIHCYNVYWSEYFGDVDLVKVRTDSITDYFKWRIENARSKAGGSWSASGGSSVSSSTLKMERGLMRRLFNYCVNANLIHKAPAFPKKFETWSGVHTLPSNKRRGRFNLNLDYKKLVKPYFAKISKGLNVEKWKPQLQNPDLPFNPESNVWESRLKWKNRKDKHRDTSPVWCHLTVRYDHAMFWFFCLLIANSGIRPSEASKLRHRDIRLLKDDGTGKYFTCIRVGAAISKVRKHRMAICRDFHVTYDRYLKYKKEVEYRFNREIKPNDFVFPETVGAGFYVEHRKKYDSVVSRHLKRMGLHKRKDGKHGIEVYFSAYSFRSFYITMRLANGMDVYTLSKNVGTSPATILKAYDVNENWVFRQAMTKHLIQQDFDAGEQEAPSGAAVAHATKWRS